MKEDEEPRRRTWVGRREYKGESGTAHLQLARSLSPSLGARKQLLGELAVVRVLLSRGV
jgi:hypothetical protein